MTQALRNYRSQGGVIDRDMAEHIACIFQELAQGVSKVKCYDRLINILDI